MICSPSEFCEQADLDRDLLTGNMIHGTSQSRAKPSLRKTKERSYGDIPLNKGINLGGALLIHNTYPENGKGKKMINSVTWGEINF